MALSPNFKMKYTLPFFWALVLPAFLSAQFSRQDSLRGSITPERAWWDLKHYELHLDVNIEDKYFIGHNIITYEVIDPANTLQIDLQPPLVIDSIIQKGELLDFRSEGNAHFVSVGKSKKGAKEQIIVYYSGHPRPAIRAPWDGGISWKQDSEGEDFVASSCQGLGASVWWPCKDHMYDEVEGMDIIITNPDHLTNVSNGRLISETRDPVRKTKTSHWRVLSPINNYGVNINIGNYRHWSDTYAGENGTLDLDYWVLEQDLEKAKEHFSDVSRMLEAFEYWFGPYPFYKDGFKLVQAPYLGMEHQSSVTYGNQFMMGYLGNDLSGTGWGLKFDFIIIHEAGHEWFANNITYKDMADMWVHEGFTSYSESLFLDYHYGKDAGQEYCRGLRDNIGNKQPMIGNYDVNDEGYPIDVYYKGSNILNTLRTVVNNDYVWRQLLRDVNKEYYHQTVTSEMIENYFASYLNLDLIDFWDQYLRQAKLPTLEIEVGKRSISYRWKNCIDGFDMPVDIIVDQNKTLRLYPTTKTQKKQMKVKKVDIDENFYINKNIFY